MRCALRVTPRMPVQVETCMPETGTGGGSVSGGGGGSQQTSTSATTTPTSRKFSSSQTGTSTPSDGSSGDRLAEINHPPGTGASRVFQILYRNEEVTLKDVILFRAHLLGEFYSLCFVSLSLFRPSPPPEGDFKLVNDRMDGSTRYRVTSAGKVIMCPSCPISSS